MFELTIGKDDFISRSKDRAFTISMNYYEQRRALVDMSSRTTIIKGSYITNFSQSPHVGIAETLNALNVKYAVYYPIIVFDNVYIYRELTQVEKDSKKAIEMFANGVSADDIDYSSSIGMIYSQIITFKRAVELLKDKNKVNAMLPVDVKSIAFIQMQNTEGDFVLSKEAQLVDVYCANNGNMFNIYKLW